VYSLGIQTLVVRHLKQGQQHVAPCLGGAGLSGYAKAIAMTGNLNIEAFLDLSQMFIKLAAKIGEAAVVGGLENDVPRNLDSIQST
jgi:hypothetical protein